MRGFALLMLGWCGLGSLLAWQVGAPAGPAAESPLFRPFQRSGELEEARLFDELNQLRTRRGLRAFLPDEMTARRAHQDAQASLAAGPAPVAEDDFPPPTVAAIWEPYLSIPEATWLLPSRTTDEPRRLAEAMAHHDLVYTAGAPRASVGIAHDELANSVVVLIVRAWPPS
jgi:hypothetical protein